MNNNNSALSIFLSALALIGVVGLGAYVFTHGPTKSYGGVTNYDSLQVKTLQVGTNGTIIGSVVTGTCSLLPAATTIAASSTVAVDCQGSVTGQPAVPLTGVNAGDAVQLGFGTTSPTTYTGLQIRGASASSTSGYITVNIFNGTGTTYTWGSTGTSSLIYQDAARGTVQGL